MKTEKIDPASVTADKAFTPSEQLNLSYETTAMELSDLPLEINRQMAYGVSPEEASKCRNQYNRTRVKCYVVSACVFVIASPFVGMALDLHSSCIDRALDRYDECVMG